MASEKPQAIVKRRAAAGSGSTALMERPTIVPTSPKVTMPQGIDSKVSMERPAVGQSDSKLSALCPVLGPTAPKTRGRWRVTAQVGTRRVAVLVALVPQRGCSKIGLRLTAATGQNPVAIVPPVHQPVATLRRVATILAPRCPVAATNPLRQGFALARILCQPQPFAAAAALFGGFCARRTQKRLTGPQL